VRVHPLRPENDRRSFDCGDMALDRFLAEFALQNMRRHVGVTYVAEELGVVLGYVTVTACSVRRRDLPQEEARSFPAYPLPALRIARLAVDRRFQRQGIGTLLTGTSHDIALYMGERVGCVAVVVDAKPNAATFYKQLGYREMNAVGGTSGARPQQIPMVLLATLAAAARDL
jgi:GNAT superfamily N-acetyltransferase